MKFSYKWLCDYLAPEAHTLGSLEQYLIQAGIEVESIVDSSSCSHFEVVQVDSVAKHPNSDHLNVCKVAGKQIVCGASNVKAGMYTVLANIGAVLPSGDAIVQTNIRGLDSFGMLCSPAELGLFGHDGIIHLPNNDCSIADIMLPNGPIFEVSITPNRGDLLSIYGLAREIAAFGGGKLKDLGLHTFSEQFEQTDEVIKIEGNSVRSMYTFRLNNLTHNNSPNWLKLRLKEVGINSKSCAVDVTNYIAHALGQPLHSFDGDKIKKIKISEYSGKFVDLKGNEHMIDKLSCMQSDDHCISVPGIIGGDYGKCEPTSKNVLLEAANYTLEHIYRGQQMVCNTVASKKFFYGIDPNLTQAALLQAAEMIRDMCGGSFGFATCAKYESHKPIRVSFDFRYTKEMGIKDQEAKTHLSKLLFEEVDDQYQVPSWRHDITTPEGLLHDVLRMHDMSKVEEKRLNPSDCTSKGIDRLNHLRNILISDGLYEAVGRDFMSKEMDEIFGQNENLRLTNPMNKSQFSLRSTILSNLIEYYDTYSRYKWQSKGLFEIGYVFKIVKENVVTEEMIGIALQAKHIDWLSSNIDDNYFTAKRMVEKCVRYLHGNEISCHSVKSHKALRDVCEWRAGDQTVGRFGIFGHESIMKKLKMKTQFYMGEVSLKSFERKKKIRGITDQEVLTKDVSFILPSNLFTSRVLEHLRSSIQDVEFTLFDVYPSAALDKSDRSVAIRLMWTNLVSALTAEQIKSIVTEVERELIKLGCIIKDDK